MTTPVSGRTCRTAVIGAGISGLAAARALQDHGHEVTVFEKSRGQGGRAATRRVGDIGVDHGAQYFTARDPNFLAVVDGWESQGVVTQWQGSVGVLDPSGLTASEGGTVRWIAVPAMNQLGRHLATGLEIRLETRVSPPTRLLDRWFLRDDKDVALGEFEVVLVSAPAPQAVELLAPAPALAEQAALVRYSPCWAAMLAFEEAPVSSFDGIFCNEGPLRWAARNDSKPGRRGNVWALHANPAWSEANLEETPEAVLAELVPALEELLQAKLPALRWGHAHRWLYALVEHGLEVGCLWDSKLRIGACGDWANRARVEGAYLSGTTLAGRVLAEL